MTVLDLILPIIVVIGFLLGYKKGFFETVTKHLKLVFALCLTILTAAPIINTWTRPFFAGKVEGWIYSSLLENCPDITAETASDSLPMLIKLMANLFKVDFSGAEQANSAEEVLSAISKEMSLPVGNLIAVVVTYVALFIVSLVLTKIILAILNKLVKKGLLGRLNKWLGLLFGGMLAAISACIISSIAYRISPEFADGAISTFFRNINPFAILMKF
ncbi:MAG: CvpA family protein [Ruminococcaceae bacterium]|nr:CvpA family protein [Oscillospiraceae bacterium]